MSAPIDSYFDFSSPYGNLARCRIDAAEVWEEQTAFLSKRRCKSC